MTGIGGRVVGIDYGSKRIGIAVSDPMRILASGRGIVENDRDALQRIAAIVHSEGASLIVVGMPYAPDGGKGKKAEEVEQFVGLLKSVVDVPIATWDESYSSVEAQRVLREGGAKRKQRQQKGRIDEMAARILLQEFLDSTTPSGDAEEPA